jgi:methionyl-tRNA formyltransferase
MLSQVTTIIDPDETSDMLEHRLAALGADAIVPVMERLQNGDATADPQDEAGATYAAKLTRADSRIEWARPSRAVHNQIRGLQPWPLATARLNGRRLSLIRSEIEHDNLLDADPGVIVFTDKDTISVACRPGVVRLLELQPEGRRIMTVREFHNGARVTVGDRFVDA